MKLFVYILATLLLIAAVGATTYLEGKDYWTNFGNDEKGTHGSHVVMGLLSEGTYSTDTNGANFEPLIADLNGDGWGEGIISSGSTLFSYYSNAGNLRVLAQIVMPEAQAGSGAIINTTYGYTVVIPTSQELLLYTINYTDFKLRKRFNITAAGLGNIQTGVVCTSWFSSTYGDTCVLATTKDYYVEYHSKTNTTVTFNISAESGTGTTGCKTTPAISTNYNGVQAAFPCGNYVEIVTVGASHIPYSINLARPVKQVGFSNVDSGGHDELVVVSNTNQITYLATYKSDGTVRSSSTVEDFGGSGGVNITFAVGAFRYSIPHICVGTFSTFGTGSYPLKCYNGTNLGLDFKVGASSQQYHRSRTTDIIAADTNTDGYDELITPFGLVNIHANSYFNFSSMTSVAATAAGHYIAVGDLARDGNPDIFGSKSGGSMLITSVGSTATTSYYTFTLNGRGVDKNLRNPVCIGSTVSISVKDCASYSIYDCNYLVSANTTSEYLYTNCGSGNITYTAGLASTNFPSVSCFFSKVGDYNFPVYLTTTITGSLPAHSARFDVLVQVRNTTAGVDCNLGNEVGINFEYGGTSVTNTQRNPSTTANQLTNFLQSINDISGLGLTTMWLIIMLFVGFAVFYYGNAQDFGNIGGLVIFMELMLLILGAFLGFIGMGIMVAVVVVAIVIIGFWLRSVISGG